MNPYAACGGAFSGSSSGAGGYGSGFQGGFYPSADGFNRDGFGGGPYPGCSNGFQNGGYSAATGPYPGCSNGFQNGGYSAATGTWDLSDYNGHGAASAWGGAWDAGGSRGAGAKCGGDCGEKGFGAKGKASGKGGFKGGKKSMECKFFAEGRCTRGSSCVFSHGEEVVQGQETEDEVRADPVEPANALNDVELAVMAKMEEEEETMVVGLQASPPDDDSDSGSDRLPPPATEGEIEEARQIVQKAQREAVERTKMKAKAQTASRGDLQAMINARLAMK